MFIFSGICLVLFVLLENPSIPAKIQHVNTQFFHFGKTSVLLFSEFCLWLCLLSSLLTFGWYRIFLCSTTLFSTLIFDVYFRLTGKVIEFQEFLLLYQSKANLLDAIMMYRTQIFESLPREAILLVAFLAPPPLCKEF